MVGTSIRVSLHDRVAERIPPLQKMNPQHGGQRIRRPSAFLAGLRVVGLDQVDQRLPWHPYLHLREKLLPFGLLLGRGELVIREAELFAAHQQSPSQPHHGSIVADAWVFLSLLNHFCCTGKDSEALNTYAFLSTVTR